MLRDPVPKDRTVSAPHRRSLVLALVMMLASLLPVGALAFLPQQGAAVAVVFAPWRSPADAFERVAAAGGLILREGAFDNILVARSDSPDFIGRLYRAGAWAVLDPIAFTGCWWGSTGAGTDRL